MWRIFAQPQAKVPTLPTILYKNVDDLPDISAVYIVRNGSIVLYVGSTIRLRARLRAHHKKEFFKMDGVTVEYIACEVQWLGPLEHKTIRELQPTLNAMMGRRSFKQRSLTLDGKLFYPFGENEVTSLRDKTIYLLNSQKDKNLKQISTELAVSYEWLCLFSRGKSINPGVNTVQKLYEYLTKSKLAV